jgi:hypothetical protein
VQASQREAIVIGLEQSSIWRFSLGENTTFISSLYDDFIGHTQARTTAVNGFAPSADRMVWFPAPRSGKLSFLDRSFFTPLGLATNASQGSTKHQSISNLS